MAPMMEAMSRDSLRLRNLLNANQSCLIRIICFFGFLCVCKLRSPVILVVTAGVQKAVDISQLVEGVFQNRIVTVRYHIPKEFIRINTILWVSN